jgi:hypothetical protein
MAAFHFTLDLKVLAIRSDLLLIDFFLAHDNYIDANCFPLTIDFYYPSPFDDKWE